MILNLTTLPTNQEHEFYVQLLKDTDYVLVSDSALGLCLSRNKTGAAGIVRSVELKKIGGRCHDDWRAIDDNEWVKLVASTSKTIVW